MQLTQFSDYALRTLIYLALRRDRLSTIEEIAAAYKISESHLTKVVHRLGKLGVAETQRGRHGGLRLGREPQDINIGWLFRQTEENLALVECFDVAHNTCPIAPVCGLSIALSEALKAFMSVLDRYSLADVTHNPRDLMPFLGIDPPPPPLPPSAPHPA